MTERKVEVVRGLAEEHVSDAFRVLFEAFANKFRTGFRHAGDLQRLFADSADRDSCYTALVDGKLAGILCFQSPGRDFFHMGMGALFTRFNPCRALLMLFNLTLLSFGDSIKKGELKVDAIAVDSSIRGVGLGTRLMNRVEEEEAPRVGAEKMTLDVLGINHGAIRLYRRLGYSITGTERGFWVWLASTSDDVHRMEKPLGDA